MTAMKVTEVSRGSAHARQVALVRASLLQGIEYGARKGSRRDDRPVPRGARQLAADQSPPPWPVSFCARLSDLRTTPGRSSGLTSRRFSNSGIASAGRPVSRYAVPRL